MFNHVQRGVRPTRVLQSNSDGCTDSRVDPTSTWLIPATVVQQACSPVAWLAETGWTTDTADARWGKGGMREMQLQTPVATTYLRHHLAFNPPQSPWWLPACDLPAFYAIRNCMAACLLCHCVPVCVCVCVCARARLRASKTRLNILFLHHYGCKYLLDI
jgi:hypothetical protein